MVFGDTIESSTPIKNTHTTMTMTISNEYWTATALGATNQPIYAKDGCGVTCIVTLLVPGSSWIPCEPWCQDCGHPEGKCNTYSDDDNKLSKLEGPHSDGLNVGEWLRLQLQFRKPRLRA